MIRLIFIVIYAIIIVFVSLIMLPAFWLIGKFNKEAKDRGSLRFVQGVFKIVLFISGVSTTVKGLENLPEADDDAVLFIGNHHGFFDIIISYTYMKPRTGYVSKKEIEKVPLLNIWMKYLYCLFLDRDNLKEGLKTILTGIDYIKSGDFRMTLDDISIAFDDQTGKYIGNMTISSYAVSGEDRTADHADVNVQTGTNNIFGNPTVKTNGENAQ